jgi:hypothetical protein
MFEHNFPRTTLENSYVFFSSGKVRFCSNPRCSFSPAMSCDISSKNINTAEEQNG